MQVLNCRHAGVGVQRDGVLAVGAQLREGRWQCGQRRQRRLPPNEFVVIQAGSVLTGRHSHHRAGEQPVSPRRGRLLLGFHAVGVEVFAAQSLDGGVEVGGDTHVHRADRPDGGRIGPQRAAIGEQRHPRHRLHSTGHRHREVTGAQSGGGVGDGVDARGAEPVDRHPRDVLTPAGQQCGGACDVGALLVDLGGAAHDDVVDQGRVHTGPLDQGVLEVDQQVGGGAVMQ